MEISKAMPAAVQAAVAAKPVARTDLIRMATRPTETPGQNRPVEPAEDSRDLRDARDALPAPASNLEFTVDEDSRRQVVRVVDSESGQVIRQLPSEAALRVARQLAEQATGLIDDQA